MYNEKCVIALIPAAGMGQRMGIGQRKQYLKLNGKEILNWTLTHILQEKMIDEAIVIVPKEDVDEVRLKVDMWMKNIDTVASVQVIAGGASRQESVFNGLCQIKNICGEETYVVVHDGVRPFFPQGKLIEFLEALASIQEIDGAIAGAEVTDTLKTINEDKKILGTVDRSKVWSVQTPQVFRFDALMGAHDYANKKSLSVTDDSALLEAVGKMAVIIPCPPDNIKITKPVDLVIAEILFSSYKVAL